MNIDGIRNLLNAPIQSVKPIVESAPTTATAPTGKSNFADMLGKAIKEVDGLQQDADKKIEGVTVGGEGVNTHTAMIALEKADVAFQLMSAVRTKIIRAYEEVMRTPV
jgi:flagellar hook-basal body complex protein FliE